MSATAAIAKTAVTVVSDKYISSNRKCLEKLAGAKSFLFYLNNNVVMV